MHFKINIDYFNIILCFVDIFLISILSETVTENVTQELHDCAPVAIS